VSGQVLATLSGFNKIQPEYNIMSSSMRTTLQTVPESLPADHVSSTKVQHEHKEVSSSISGVGFECLIEIENILIKELLTA
jgi:hypothetical protein